MAPGPHRPIQVAIFGRPEHCEQHCGISSQDILEGKPLIPTALRYVDVRDVAQAHVAAAEEPSAKGRYLLGYHSTVPAKEISDALQVSGCHTGARPPLPPQFWVLILRAHAKLLMLWAR